MTHLLLSRASLLLCHLGWHAPAADVRWNAGYGFTRCRRCRRDMVRSLFGEWHVPRHFRVYWGAKAPAERGDLAVPSPPVAANDDVVHAAWFMGAPLATGTSRTAPALPFDFSDFN